MKTREEYLIAYEEKLLSLLKDYYSSINKNIFINYSLAALVILFSGGFVQEVRFLSVEFNLSLPSAVFFISFLMSILYISAGFNILRVASLFNRVVSNSEEIIGLNNDARPVTLEDLELFSFGLVGFVLSFSKFQANRLFKIANITIDTSRGVSFGTRRIIFWLLNLIILLLLLALFLILPSIVVLFYVYVEFFIEQSLSFYFSFLAFLVLFISVLMLLICEFVLFGVYLIDIIKTFSENVIQVILGEPILKSIAQLAKVLIPLLLTYF